MGDYDQYEKREIRLDLVALYRAGNVELPDKAGELADVAETMATSVASVSTQLASIGSPGVGSDVLDLMGACHEGVPAR